MNQTITYKGTDRIQCTECHKTVRPLLTSSGPLDICKECYRQGIANMEIKPQRYTSYDILDHRVHEPITTTESLLDNEQAISDEVEMIHNNNYNNDPQPGNKTILDIVICQHDIDTDDDEVRSMIKDEPQSQIQRRYIATTDANSITHIDTQIRLSL